MQRKRQMNSITHMEVYFSIIGFIFILSKIAIVVYAKNTYGWLEYSLLLILDVNILFAMYRCFVILHKENKKVVQSEKITRGMMEITNDILSYGDTGALLQIILEKAIELIPNAQKGSILVRDGDEFAYKASVGYDFEVLKTVKLRLEETFQYNATGLHEPSIVVNIEEFDKENLRSETLSQLNQKNILKAKAVLSSAIMIKGEIYGTINLDNMDNVDAFCEEDKLIIKHFADQIGIALKNAKLVAEMLEISRFDGLTNIYNRKYFEELFEQQYDIAKRYKQILTTCVMDLNNLKHLNDTFGHAAGDKLLAFFADTIRKNIREVDLFARIGGDEFAIVFLNTDTEQVNRILEKIEKIFKQNPLKFGDDEHLVSFAFGTAEYPREGEDTKKLIKVADDKMYVHKGIMKGIRCEIIK